MRVLSFSETGHIRKNNEDALLALPKCGLYVVADGMGGHLAGEVAARLALSQLEKLAPQLENIENNAIEEWAVQAVAQANRAVYESSNLHPENKGMGTTLTAAIISGDAAVIAHVGDSRAYLWQEKKLVPLTVDHSLVEELVRMGQITSKEAETHPQRHILTRALGTAEEIQVDCTRLTLRENDALFLCTDGVTKVLSTEDLAWEFQSQETWEERWDKIKQLVLDRGAPDNFTALCCVMG